MESIGRRERKKLATAAAIEWAALYLAVTDGLDATTVEAISERADVTSRTFFNHFASKEDAVLGITKTAIPPFDHGNSFALAETAFEQARHRIRGLLTEPGQGDVDRTRMRREVAKSYPELIAHEYQHFASAGSHLRLWVEELLRKEGALTEGELTIKATSIVHTVGAAYQIAAHTWSSDLAGARSLAEHFDDAFTHIAQLMTEARTS